MAGGNLSPRQKMINMMYLVLTALLALNVSREVMDAFFEVMKGQETSIETVEKQNANVYAAFESAARENPAKAGEWRDKAQDVKAKSDQLYNKLEETKNKLVEITGGLDETGKPKKMDDKERVANYMIVEQNGEAIKTAMDSYREFLLGLSTDNPGLSKAIEATFDTHDHKDETGANEPWVKAKFEHYPLISVLTFITGMQSDVRTAEANVIDFLKTRIGADDISFTGVKAVVMPKSTFVNQGDTYEADVFLAAYDDTQDPEIVIEGNPLSPDDIEGGVGKVRFPANRIGITEWSGEIRIKSNGEVKPYPVSGFFNVAPPSVVIAATKMNVLYRGVDNPLEISVPGVDPANIIVSNSEVKKQADGTYVADVTRYNGGEIDIKVSIKENGEVKPMGTKKYRIKSLPNASGYVWNRSEGLISPSLLSRGEIEAKFDNFDFDLELKVTGFEIVVPPMAPFQCNGNKLSSNAKAALSKAKPGTTVIIRSIKAVTAKGIKPKVAPITLDLN